MCSSLMKDLLSAVSEQLLKILLTDHTTKNNLIWATKEFASYGEDCGAEQEIALSRIDMLYSSIIMPRIFKPEDRRILRTRKMAEVFTPSWVCNMQNNVVDDDWFGRKNVFNETSNASWKTISDPIVFPEDPHKSWKKYVDSKRLEITCGEAPYLTSRYDMVTGENIDIKERIGILDRKLRIVNENTENETDWFQWAKRACQSTYGYEYQGDSVLIARLNLLLTFEENFEFRWQRKATPRELEEIAQIISWNIWQMDGLHDTVPAIMPEQNFGQLSLFGMTENTRMCRIMNWRAQRSVEFSALKTMNLPFSDKADSKGRKANMKFDVIIGNPPYQEETESDSTRKPPIYNFFMEQTYKIGNVVELITPARFLFNAGYTPKAWNEKMLNDPHLKVEYYEPDSEKVFDGITIKGGIAITYRDARNDYGKIGVFTKYPYLNSILKHVENKGFNSIENIISSPLSYQLSDKMKNEHPELLDRLRSSAFSTLKEIFYESKPHDQKDYISFVGLLDNKRVRRYIQNDYIEDKSGTLNSWKLLLPKAIGTGTFGETLSAPVIAEPGVGYTQTFIGIGKFDSKEETVNLNQYIKTKFLRTMLGILKITQDCPGPKWKYVPLQDFTSKSDIDWTTSITDIDQQLYKKYGLDENEINFIETKVKGME